MSTPGFPALFRAAMALLSVGIVGGGLFFALRGGESGQTASPGPARLEASAVASARPASTASAEPTAMRVSEPTAVLASPSAEAAESPAAPATPAAAVAAPQATPVLAAANPTPTTPQSAPTVGAADLPQYRDVQVLAMAADAVLPSGKTFRQCVEAPPSTEHWPTPVHLYYEGRGKWLVETHLSEVQVVFDEVSGRFSARNFAPPNPGCR